MPTPTKFDHSGPTSKYLEYGGQESIAPLYMWQPPPTSHHPYPAVPQPVVYALPRNSPPQQILFHRRGDSEATIVERWAYGRSSPPSSSYSLKRSSSMAAPSSSSHSVIPGRIIVPELLQRPITSSSVLALEMENRRSTSPSEHRRNISRIINDDTSNSVGNLVPPPRPVAAHPPSIGSRLERCIKGTSREQSTEQQPNSWEGPSHGAPLSAVLGPQDAPVFPPTPTQLAQRSPYSPKRPFVHGHHRTRSRPGFL
jgi:hypothetical protein